MYYLYGPNPSQNPIRIKVLLQMLAEQLIGEYSRQLGQLAAAIQPLRWQGEILPIFSYFIINRYRTGEKNLLALFVRGNRYIPVLVHR
jgi:hypothetical protein